MDICALNISLLIFVPSIFRALLTSLSHVVQEVAAILFEEGVCQGRGHRRGLPRCKRCCVSIRGRRSSASAVCFGCMSRRTSPGGGDSQLSRESSVCSIC